jgi:hypothetical protein
VNPDAIARSVPDIEPLVNEHLDPDTNNGKSAQETRNGEDKILPQLDAADRNLERISHAALKILVAANDPPFIFRHADCVSRIQQSDSGSMLIRPLSEASLRGILARKIHRYAKSKKKTISELPPKHVVQDILANPSPPFPLVTRVVGAPIFAKDGTLATKRGYSAEAKVYYDPGDAFDVGPVPKKPEPEDTAFAQEQIRDIFFDFPFTSEAELAHAVGLIVQPFARELIDGPTPLYLIEKPSPGTGAGLFSDVVTSTFLGRPAAVISEGRDEDEWRKRITSKLIQDNNIVLIDNVRRRLESSALSSALTCMDWEDRILGKTGMVRVPVRATWIATGNNPSLSNEIARRTIRIRLDSKLDGPWLRDGFRHPNLREYVAKERSKLAWCALVLIQDWIAKDRPAFSGKPLGSFEAWSNVIGGIVETAGFTAFLTNLEALYEESDAEGAALRAFVALWWEKYGTDEVGVSELYSFVNPADGEPLDIDLGNGKTERSQKTRLGLLLKQNRDRQFDGKRLVRVGAQQGATKWRLVDTKK